MSETESVPLPADEPLRTAEVGEVLRYWLAALRFEEALTSRPRAHRLRRRPVVDLREPRGGQPYFKLRGDGEAGEFLLRRAASVVLDLDAERTAFFLRWLRLCYFAQRSPFPGWDGDPGAVVVGWPVVYFARTEELAGLFRMRGSAKFFGADGKRFEPPDYGARRSGRLPPVPTQVQVVRVDDEDEGLLPFSLDEQLLTRTLGVTEEELAELYRVLKGVERVSPAVMVATVCALLESEGAWAPGLGEVEGEGEGLFERARAAVAGRLVGGKAQVYGVGLVHDGDQVFATRHLQRELLQLVERRVGVPPWGQKSPLWGYLSGKAARSGWAPMRGLRAPRALTVDQRAVAERFLGSSLTAAQGPPGTGKTELLLNLAASALVERVAALCAGKSMPRDLLLVASTNNRAVDHVLEPLAEGGLPLGLRVGNMAVLSTVTLELVGQVVAWLEVQRAGEAEARAALDGAIERFEAARAVVDAGDAPRVEGRQQARRRAVLADRIAARESALARVGEVGVAPGPGLADELDRKVRAMAQLLERLARTIERGGPELVTRLLNIWRTQRKRVVGKLDKAAAEIEPPVVLDWGLPPEVEAGSDEAVHIAAWDEGVDEARALLDGLEADLKARREAEEHRAALGPLRDEWALLPAESATPVEGAGAEAQYAVYAAAVAVREAWAVVHAEPLRAALATVSEALGERRGLRRLIEDDPNASDWLLRVFPVWGSTLLSLGNVLPALPRAGLGLVIDEAGQCHPAYAVAGLMRAERALLIGDVNQLEPVIQLGAEDDARIRGVVGLRLEKHRLGPYRVMAHAHGSAQALADRAVDERLSLHEHFRCQPEIIALSDALCGYGLVVRTPPPAGPAPLPGAVLLAAVRGGQTRVRGSWYNADEVGAVMALLRELARVGVAYGEVAVITPYVGQLDALRDAMRQARVPIEQGGEAELELFGGGGVALGTVHRFQGGERRVVVFSTVVTEARSLRFLNGRVNLVNVAVSRAREHLVVVGDPATLRGGPYTRLLVERASPVPIPTRGAW